MKQDIKSTEENWNKIARTWELGTPPARPDEEDVSYLRNRLATKVGSKKRSVLVLGSTPEIRDMLFSLGDTVEVTCVDISFDMLAAMTRVMKETSEREMWMRANWIDCPLKEKYFDFVLGDAVVHNVPRSEQKVFLSHIASLLKEDGEFVTRIPIHQLGTTSKIDTPDQIFDTFIEQTHNPWAAGELIVTLFFVTTSEGEMSAMKIKDFLGDYFNQQEGSVETNSAIINEWLASPFDKGWLETTKVFSVLSQDETETLLNERFDIVDTFVSPKLQEHPVHQFAGDCFLTYSLSSKRSVIE